MKTNYPTIITIGRFAKWSLTTLKNTLFGIGGVTLLIIVGLYIAGALIEFLRWYLVVIASALLLLCIGLLAISYARSILNRFTSHQRTKVSDINTKVSDINTKVSDINTKVSDINTKVSDINTKVSDINTKVSDINKEIAVIKDDVFIIGYDILREQDKLTQRVSQLENQPNDDCGADDSHNDRVE